MAQDDPRDGEKSDGVQAVELVIAFADGEQFDRVRVGREAEKHLGEHRLVWQRKLLQIGQFPSAKPQSRTGLTVGLVAFDELLFFL